MNYTQTIEFLFNALPQYQQVGGGAYKPGLERIASFCRSLGNPQDELLSIHVAGTNGKGSVSHMLAAILQSAGYRVGLFTSPHLHDFRERIRIDGEMIPESAVVRFVEDNLPYMQANDLSFFEMTAAMAFDHFARQNVEVAVIETGLGGRLDATNILHPILSVITNIGLEHTEYLGNTPAKIASEKAGIIKPGIPVVIGETDPQTAPVFLAKADECDANIVFADHAFSCESACEDGIRECFTVRHTGSEERTELKVDLQGACQQKNILTVLAAVQLLRSQTQLSISTRALREGCLDAAAMTGLQGRWQVIGRKPLTVCDTGHNAHGLKTVVPQIRAVPHRELYMVFGVVKEKDLDAILPLLPAKAHYIFTQAANGRALDAAALRDKATAYRLKGEVVPQVDEAVSRAKSLARPADMIFIGGSTFVVAEALACRKSEQND